MKSLLIFILILNLPILSFSQSDCCKQIITTKTNAPFDCLNDVNRKIQNKKISELRPGGSFECNDLNKNRIFIQWGSNSYGYKGQLVKVYTYEIPLISQNTIFINDACETIEFLAVTEVGPAPCSNNKIAELKSMIPIK